VNFQKVNRNAPAGGPGSYVVKTLPYLGAALAAIAIAGSWSDTGAGIEWPVWGFWLTAVISLYGRIAGECPGLRSVVRWSLWSAAGLSVGVLGLLALCGASLSPLQAFGLLAACLALVTGVFFGWWYPLDRRSYASFAVLAVAASLVQLYAGQDSGVAIALLAVASAIAPQSGFARLSTTARLALNPAEEAVLLKALAELNRSFRLAKPRHICANQ
jgi:hypothetical protein